MTVSSKELVERMRASLPMAMTLPDPITGSPFTVNRDNVLALLAVDMDNLVLESQTVAMLFGEMARVHAATKLAKEQADVDFRRWKAAKAAEGRAKLTKEGGKVPTKDQVEEYYRAHDDYGVEYAKTNRATVIADMIADLKEAFALKQKALHDLHGVTFGHDRVQSTDDRMREMEAHAEAFAAPMMRAAADELKDILHSGPGAPPRDPKATSSKTAKKPPTEKGTAP